MGWQQLEGEAPRASQDAVAAPEELTAVLSQVARITGVDLRVYRQSGVARRATNRLRKMGCQDYRQYLDLISREPEEATRFLEYVVIKWSSFFRDKAQLAGLQKTVFPDIFGRADGDVAIWSAGCGRGEEPYTIALLLDSLSLTGASIYGTDIDEEAISSAHRHVYSGSSLSETPADVVARYFAVQTLPRGLYYRLDDRIADRVRFTRHDLLSGASPAGFSSARLVLCRNVLIYLQRPAQDRVFTMLIGALAPGGYLCLGEAEQPPASCQASLETVDRKLRIYRKRRSG